MLFQLLIFSHNHSPSPAARRREGGREEGRGRKGGRKGGREKEGERWREEGETTELATVNCIPAELILLTLLVSSESFSVRD